MSKDTHSSLFISSSVKQSAGFYQYLLKGITTYWELGARVVTQIETAHSLRQIERAKELSGILVRMPVREYQNIGQYYAILCQGRAECDANDLDALIDRTQTYKSKALISRGWLDLSEGRPEIALLFYTEALKANSTHSDCIVASRAIALTKSMEGFHGSALKDLERLIPQLVYAEPIIYYDVLNSYAVELIEANRLSEAENVSRRVVSSPFAPYYPEWRETREDISERRISRATVTFSAASVPETINLLHMPLRERSALEPFTAQERAAVLDMQAWKNRKMTNKDERPPKPTTSEEKQARLKELEKLRGREILVQIMSALGDESVGDESLRKALAVLEGLDEI